MGREDILNENLIYICSYDIATKVADQFKIRGIKIAIVDEAHNLKNKDSNRSKTLSPIL